MHPHKLAMWFICLSIVFFSAASAKEAPLQVIDWPTSGTAVVRFSFGKFKEISSAGKQHVHTTDITAENL